MTELALYQPSTLAEQIDYAKTVAVGDLLPQSFRNKPANVLIAVGLGQAMGLSPAESLYRINVIQGKPTASAELIAANVRKAGHKLRVTGDETQATATIIRADDPEFEFTETRDIEWAKRMGLDKKDNYKSQPATMLQWRAITAVARLACPEALYGVIYTADEIADERPVQAARVTVADLRPTVTDAEPLEPSGLDEFHPDTTSNPDPPEGITPAQLKALHASLNDAGIAERDDALAMYGEVTGRDIGSSKELTRDEASRVLDYLQTLKGDALFGGGVA